MIKATRNNRRNKQHLYLNSSINNNNLNLEPYNPGNQSNRNKVVRSEKYDKINNRSDKSGLNLMCLFNNGKKTLII